MPIVKIHNCLNCAMPHEWVFEGLTLRELRVIKKLTGLTSISWAEAMDVGDPDATAALIYVLHQRNKITIPFDDVDLDFNDFDMDETEDEKVIREQAEKVLEEAGKAETESANGLTEKVA
jgi:hypothetical protein